MKRRGFLAALGCATTGLAGCNGHTGTRPTPTTTPLSDALTGTAARSTPAGEELNEERLREQFGTVIDVRDDLGCDPTGREPCDGRIDEALTDDTLLLFPSGSYRITDTAVATEVSQVGFLGKEDATLAVPSGFNDKVLSVEADRVVYANLDIDITSHNSCASLRFICDDDLQVRSTEYHGRGTHTDPTVEFAMFLAVRDPNATGLVQDVTIEKGSALGHYKHGTGRGGIWIGSAHQGMLRVERLRLEEFGNNGIYGSRCPGDVRVHNSFFRNNSPTSVRISGQESYIENSTVVIDMDEYSGPMTHSDRMFPRGFVVEQGPDENPPGVEIRNCEATVRNAPNPVPAIHAWSTGHTIRVVDTDITHLSAGPAIYRSPRVTQGPHEPASRPRWIALENVTIDARSTESPAVKLLDAPGSTLRNVRIKQRGGPVDAVDLRRSPGTIVDGGSIAAVRYPIRVAVDGADATDSAPIAFRLIPSLDTGHVTRAPANRPVRVRHTPLDEIDLSPADGATAAMAILDVVDRGSHHEIAYVPL